MLVDADLHLHGRYSGGTSFNMELPLLAEQAGYKGLDLLGTADCLHQGWLRHIKSTLVDGGDGIFSHKDFSTKFILQTEVEAEKRVHHILLLPDIGAVETLRKDFSKYGKLDVDGRPKIALTGQEVSGKVHDAGGLVGIAHAFTPYTSMYGAFESVKECYGTETPDFLELGLSANTELANPIDELKKITFTTNSDAHGPWPHRIGREFNRMEVKDLSFDSVSKSVKKGNIKMNIGVPCVYGKYHLSRCVKCGLFYSLEDMKRVNRRCTCGGIIKRGVKDRMEELGIGKGAERPPYLTITPLAEIIALSCGVKSPTSVRVQRIWKALIDEFKTEIKVLVDVPVEDIKRVDRETAKYIELFRNKKLEYYPGGGGEYGYLLKPGAKKSAEFFKGQKSLESY